MVIGLIILIPLSSLISGLLVFKAYQKGLNHSWKIKHDIEPNESKNPIIEMVSKKKEEKEILNQASILNEWLNGKEGE